MIDGLCDMVTAAAVPLCLVNAPAALVYRERRFYKVAAACADILNGKGAAQYAAIESNKAARLGLID